MAELRYVQAAIQIALARSEGPLSHFLWFIYDNTLRRDRPSLCWLQDH